MRADRIEAPVTVKTYLMCVFASFGGIFFGYDIGWMGGVLGMPWFIHLYTNMELPGDPRAAHLPAEFALPAWQKSLMTSILSAGTFFGALIGVRSISTSYESLLAACLVLLRLKCLSLTLPICFSVTLRVMLRT